MTLFHGWESGTDNSPRWDAPYASVEVGVGLPAYTRRDKAHVSDACQRPSDHEYDRYLWLVEEAKAAGYDAGLLRETGSFQVGDVLFTAIFAVASDLLSALARSLRKFDEADELKDYAVQARAAVFCHVDESTGLAADVDLRTGEWLRTETCAGFAPLIAGGMPASMRSRSVSLLMGPRWRGTRRFRSRCRLRPRPAAYDPDCYWRGPVWPVFTWLLCWALCARARTRWRPRCGRPRLTSSGTRRSPSTTSRRPARRSVRCTSRGRRRWRSTGSSTWSSGLRCVRLGDERGAREYRPLGRRATGRRLPEGDLVSLGGACLSYPDAPQAPAARKPAPARGPAAPRATSG